jgi:uncharacterized protein (TIGR00730 family)
MTLRSVCVFCGSKSGNAPAYTAAAAALGTALAERAIRLVYGGGNSGLMGVMADSCMAAGGEVVGVMPGALADREVAHRGITKLHIVGSMHERKALMAQLADAFIALPGGFGTFDELFEIVTWRQIGLHGKPIGLLDVRGYYQPLLQMADHAVAEGFIKPDDRSNLLSAEDPALLLASLSISAG